MGTLLAAASWLGSDDDEPWDAEVALKNTLAETFGTTAADVMAHGLSRLTPWDISGRVGLNTLIFPDVQEGLREGPVAGFAGGCCRASGCHRWRPDGGDKADGGGKYLFGLEAMLPAALRGPVKAIRYGTEGSQGPHRGDHPGRG